MNDDHREEQPLPAALNPRVTRVVRSRKRQTAGWVMAVRALCAVLSVVLLTATAYGTALLNRVQSAAGTLDGTDGENNVDRLGNYDDENILVVGNDSRFDYTEEDLAKIGASAEVSMATDTIMLIHVPANGKSASVVSFPRDSYVDIPGFGSNKINSAYAFGYNSLADGATEQQRQAAGQESLIATVSQLSGMKVDHYVEVSLIGFYDLTQSLGGIEVNLCEATYDETQNSGADFPAGKQTLDGSQALSFVRQRYGIEGGDLGRIKRQQYFVGAVIRKVLDQDLLDLANVGKLTDIIDALAGTISYDKNLDPIDLAEQMSAVAAGNVEFQTIPLAEYYEQEIDGASVILLADQEELDAFFASLNDGPQDKPQEEEKPASETTTPAPEKLDPSQVSVEVYNGTTVEGAAQTTADELVAKGFNVTAVLSAATTDWTQTTVQYPPGMEAEAATVAAAVPGAKTEETTDVGSVLLIIGAEAEDTGESTETSDAAEPAKPDDVMTAAEGSCVY